MFKLWQWHRVTAIGEKDIIAIARQMAIEEYAHHLAMVANGPEKIETFEHARDYIEGREIGAVSEYEICESNDVIFTEEKILRSFRIDD